MKMEESEEAMVSFSKQYALEKFGNFQKKMKSKNLFVFECQLEHKFILSNKQIINGKWCSTCPKIVTKLQKKLTKENLQVLSFNGSDDQFNQLENLLETHMEGLQSHFEETLMNEKITDELKERKLLENRFQRWTTVTEETSTSTGKPILLLGV